MAQLASLISKCEDAIADDKLLVLAVTSQARGALESDETAFGGGKTTFAMRLSRRLNHFARVEPWEPKKDEKSFWRGWSPEMLDELDYDERTWTSAFTNLWYFPVRLLDSVETATDARIEKERQLVELYQSQHPEDPNLLGFDLKAGRAASIIKGGVWEDAQLSAGSGSGVPKALKDLRGKLTTDRLGLAVLIITSNSYGEIASPIRGLVQEEVIIPKRGSIVVQHHQRKKDFKRGSKEKDILVPREAWDSTVLGPLFKPFPPIIQMLFNSWRHEKMKLAYPTIRSELNRYQRLTASTETLTPKLPRAAPMPVVAGLNRVDDGTV